MHSDPGTPYFAIAECVLTVGEYGEFLKAVERETGLESTEEHVPQTMNDGHLHCEERRRFLALNLEREPA